MPVFVMGNMESPRGSPYFRSGETLRIYKEGVTPLYNNRF